MRRRPRPPARAPMTPAQEALVAHVAALMLASLAGARLMRRWRLRRARARRRLLYRRGLATGTLTLNDVRRREAL